MRRIATLARIALFAALPTWLAAQPVLGSQNSYPSDQPDRSGRPHGAYPARDHGELGVFADYFRFAPGNTTTNFVGLGGRVGVNVHRNIALEGEMSYDFARNFTSTSSNGTTTTFVTTGVRPLTGLFGPKLQFGTSGPFRAFVTGKVGFLNFSTTNPNGLTGNQFSNAIAGVGGPGTHLAVYPGGGIEMFAGFLGLRIDAGDEIYLNNGTYNNLKVSAGPVIRF